MILDSRALIFLASGIDRKSSSCLSRPRNGFKKCRNAMR